MKSLAKTLLLSTAFLCSSTYADEFYDVTVQTGWHKHAGTDSSIYVTLYGKNGNSGRKHLNIRNYNDNERGQKSTYTFAAPVDLGPIEKVVAYNSYDDDDGPGWQLHSMRVTKIRNKQAWYFPCNKWLASNQKTTRILYPFKNCY